MNQHVNAAETLNDALDRHASASLNVAPDVPLIDMMLLRTESDRKTPEPTPQFVSNLREKLKSSRI